MVSLWFIVCLLDINADFIGSPSFLTVYETFCILLRWHHDKDYSSMLACYKRVTYV